MCGDRLESDRLWNLCPKCDRPLLARYDLDSAREAIDLTGERLAGAAVVGVGLPAICAERELIRSYFDVREGKGFDYAYSYPGIIRVLQAAGRVIRSEKDRGVVFLIDERFARPPYRYLLPADWHPATVRSSLQIEDSLTRFWTVPTPSLKGQE